MGNFQTEIVQLFEEAKIKNEFDFVLTLINYRGMGTHKMTTNLYEWFEAMEHYFDLFSAESDIKRRARMGLLIYSTFQENNDFYNIIGSLCNIKLGLKPSSYLYWKTKKYEKILGVGQKQNFLLEKLDECDFQEIIRFFNENVSTSIRNNFFHSAYALSEDEIVLHDSEPAFLNGIEYYDLDIEGDFFPVVDRVILFFSTFKRMFFDNFNTYTSNKSVTAHFPNQCNAIILGNENGLQGFKITNGITLYGKTNDSGIWYNSDTDMFEGHNILFNLPNLETIELIEKIERYEAKNEIRQNNAEFFNLVEHVWERNKKNEIDRVINLLLKYGEIKYQKYKDEDNPFKKKNLAKNPLTFLERALELMEGRDPSSEIGLMVEELKIVLNG